MGFKEAVKGDSSSKFTLVAVDNEPSIFRKLILRDVIRNHTDPPFKLTVVSFCYANVVPSSASIQHLDYTENDYAGIDALHEAVTGNMADSNRKVLVIDDLSLFWQLSGREIEKLSLFLQSVLRKFSKVFILYVNGTISRCGNVDAVACAFNYVEKVIHIRDRQEKAPGFTCNILWLKPSGKTVVENSYLAIKDGQFEDIAFAPSKHDKPGDTEDVMRSLTTFKLTVEDKEKQSRELLNLPYFGAQRTSVPNPEEEFYDDLDDDDDED